MEQKNTLWIIAAVGAFLLVVLGGAALMFSNSRTPSPIKASVAPVDKKNTDTGWINPPQSSSTAAPIDYAHSPVTTDELVVYTENTTITTPQVSVASAEQTGTTIDLNNLKNSYISETPAQNINITLNVPEQSKASATVEKTTVTAEVKAPAAGTEKTNTTVTAPAVKTSTATTSSTTKTTSTNTSKPKATVVEEKKVTQYWVQVAAYSSKKAAETARSALDENKIQSDIFTYKDNKDKLFYRVRVGPYTTKSEAEYWKSRILKISEFEKSESYVTSTTN